MYFQLLTASDEDADLSNSETHHKDPKELVTCIVYAMVERLSIAAMQHECLVHIHAIFF